MMSRVSFRTDFNSVLIDQDAHFDNFLLFRIESNVFSDGSDTSRSGADVTRLGDVYLTEWSR